MDEPTDEELMARVARDATSREGSAATATLWARHHAGVFRFLARRTGSLAAAEEALQETWLRVHRHAGTFAPGRRFRPWLFAIAANCGRDTYAPAPDAFALAPLPDEPSDLRDRLAAGLAALHPDDRRLLLLSVEGFDGAELAAMLGIGPGAVRMRLSRARARVRAALEALDA